MCWASPAWASTAAPRWRRMCGGGAARCRCPFSYVPGATPFQREPFAGAETAAPPPAGPARGPFTRATACASASTTWPPRRGGLAGRSGPGSDRRRRPWRAEARFDGWSEHFRPEAWSGRRAVGITLGGPSRPRSAPWQDVVDARPGRRTSCRRSRSQPAAANPPRTVVTALVWTAASAAQASRWRCWMSFWLVGFTRSRSRSVSVHLDTARAMPRTFARAGVPSALSQGIVASAPVAALPLLWARRQQDSPSWRRLQAGRCRPPPGGAARRSAPGMGLRPSVWWSTAIRGGSRSRPSTHASLGGPRRARALAAPPRVSATSSRWPLERTSPKGRRSFDLKSTSASAAAGAGESERACASRSATARRHDDAAAAAGVRASRPVGRGPTPRWRRLEPVRIRWKDARDGAGGPEGV